MKGRRASKPDPLGKAALLGRARKFLERHSWCRRILRVRVGRVWPGILGAFQAEIEPAKPGVDTSLWVIVGDVPPAYLVMDGAPDVAGALKGYVFEMRRWIKAAKGGRSISRLIPVENQDGTGRLLPTRELADILETRLRFIEAELIPASD